MKSVVNMATVEEESFVNTGWRRHQPVAGLQDEVAGTVLAESLDLVVLEDAEGSRYS